jgi:hypothetical protein
MYSNVDQALTTMTEALRQIEKTNTSYPNTVSIQMFLTSKSDEIVEIYKGADRTQKNSVFEVMRKLDPGNSGKYNAIRG